MSIAWRDRPEGGNAAALKLIVWIAQHLGRTVTHLILVPVAFYFYVFRRNERRFSRQFLSRIYQAPVSSWQVFLHFLTFSRVVADRIFFLTGYSEKIPIDVHGAEQLRKLVDKGKGGIILASHIGSFEAARVLGRDLGGVVIRIVLNRGVNKKFVQQLEALSSEFAESIIESEQGAAGLGLKISESLMHGEWVGFLADRYKPGDRTVVCDFLGDQARFPAGPLIIASVFKVPVICIFPLYIRGRYEVYCEIISDEFNLPRESRNQGLQDGVQVFADRVSEYARKAPYNWFNFYDFWQDTKETEDAHE
jgi:predicted LPLAT superfamily acyltransferase